VKERGRGGHDECGGASRALLHSSRTIIVPSPLSHISHPPFLLSLYLSTMLRRKVCNDKDVEKEAERKKKKKEKEQRTTWHIKAKSGLLVTLRCRMFVLLLFFLLINWVQQTRMQDPSHSQLSSTQHKP